MAANAATDPVKVVFCGIVEENSILTGQGSGPRTFVLRVTSGPGGGTFIFGVAPAVPLPLIGTYLCGQFTQGAPLNGLVALLGPSDPGYVAPAGAPAAGTLPSTSTQPHPMLFGWFHVVLFTLVALASISLLVAQSTTNKDLAACCVVNR